ncbi:MAG: polysaccharide deacetylase [Lachnospiraceae bacterium]|nr:polysaccharide deacetylase [Lachnospiraceae bacterium]
MTRQEYLERKRRHKRIMRIRAAVKAAIYLLAVLICVLVVMGAVRLVKKIAGHFHKEPEEIVTEEPVIAGDTAKKQAMTNPVQGEVGWNYDETGWWYKYDDGTQAADGWKTIDGQRYYFTDTGYLAKGWVEVDGDDYFFKDSGIQDPNAHLKRVALTYDDGPAETTRVILDTLEQYNAKATFFVVGTQAEYYDDELRREVELGMEVGSHTYDHDTLYGADAEFIRNTMEKNDRTIQEIAGITPEIMRPTGGGYDATVRENVGKPMLIWDVDTLDWYTKDPENTYNVIMDEIQDGSVILMHDIWKATGEATQKIVPALIEQGYKLVTVSELARANGFELEDGVPYYSFYPADSPANQNAGSGEESPEESGESAEESSEESAEG